MKIPGWALKDLKGQRFGRLVVLQRSNKLRDKHGHALWDCRCDCGVVKMVRGKNLLRDTSSCGCLQKERLEESNRRYYGSR